MAVAMLHVRQDAGQYPDLTPLVTPDNHGPAITAAAYFCMTMMLLFLLARAWIRWPLKSLFGSDDWTAVAASVVATIQTVLVLVAVHHGLGRKNNEMSTDDQLTVLKLIYSSSIFYVIAIALSKVAMVFLCHRLSVGDRQRKICHLLNGAIVLWAVASILLLSLRTDVDDPWGFSSLFGRGTLNRWIAIEATGAVFEVCIVVFIVWIVSPLQTSRSTKFSVFAGFSARIPVIAIAVVRLYYINQALDQPQLHSLFAWTLPEIFTQLEMSYSLIAATVPCLRIFLKSFTSGFLGGVGLDAPDNYGSRTGALTGQNDTTTSSSSRRKWSSANRHAPNAATAGARNNNHGKPQSIELLSPRKHQLSSTLSRGSMVKISSHDNDDAASDGSGNPLCEVIIESKPEGDIILGPR